MNNAWLFGREGILCLRPTSIPEAMHVPILLVNELLPHYARRAKAPLSSRLSSLNLLHTAAAQVQSPDWAEAVCVKSFISYLPYVGGFLRVLRFPPPEN